MSPMFLPSLVLLSILLSSSYTVAWAARAAPKSRQVLAANVGGAWGAFERLADARRGSRVNGMAELKRYLHRFGYLPSKPRQGSVEVNFSDDFDEELESAVSLYQRSHGISATGRLDARTLSQIMTPRCGMGDGDMRRGGKNLQRYAFFTGRPSWHRPSSPMNLTFGFSPTNFIGYIPNTEVKAAFRRAFARWEEVIPVKFVEAENYSKANIKVGFYGGDHGDGEPFDGVLGVLAHAFSPENGRLHLDKAERWAVDFDEEESPVAVDLESVATHEIGHVLGLAHSSVKEAVMYPSFSPRKKKLNLRRDDVQGVQLLYGSNPNFSPDSLLAEETSSSARIKGVADVARRSCLGASAVALYATIF